MRSVGPPALIAIVVSIVLMTSSTALTQSDGDLFAHIALGRDILRVGAPASVTPAWGSAVVLAALHRRGGLSLIAVCVAWLAACTHAWLMLFIARRGMPLHAALPAAMLSVVFAASHWLARPHAVTIAASALLIALLEWPDRCAWLAIPPLFLLWANLHGGWSYGLILVACYVVARPTWPSLMLLVASALATLTTPYGTQLHRTVLQTLRDPTIARVINEYQPPSVHNPQDLLFLVTLAISTVVLLRAMLRQASRPPLAALLVILVSAAAALRAGRNISLFAVTGWPLLVVYLVPHSSITPSPVTSWSSPARWPFARDTVNAIALLVFAALVAGGARAAGLAGVPGFTTPVSPARFPVGALQALQRDHQSAPLLTTWAWSGYVPYAWPGRRALFNPLNFTPADVHALGTLLRARPGWRRALDSLDIRLAVLPPDSPLADALRAEPAWPVWYRDPTAIVFQRQSALPNAPSASAVATGRAGCSAGTRPPPTAPSRQIRFRHEPQHVSGVHESEAQTSDRCR